MDGIELKDFEIIMDYMGWALNASITILIRTKQE